MRTAAREARSISLIQSSLTQADACSGRTLARRDRDLLQLVPDVWQIRVLQFPGGTSPTLHVGGPLFQQRAFTTAKPHPSE